MPLLPPPSRLLRLVLFEDWGLKLICLCLAAAMWFYIDGELTDVRDFNITLRPSDVVLPQGWELAAGRPMPRISVRLRGPRRKLSLATDSALYFPRKPAVEEPVAGRNVLNLSTASVAADGFDVLGITPRDDTEIAIELMPALRTPGGQVSRSLRLPVRMLAPSGAAVKVEPAELNVTVSGALETDLANVLLVADWPSGWPQVPPTGGSVELPALNVTVRAVAPAGVNVAAEDGTALPAVSVKGAWVPALLNTQ